MRRNAAKPYPIESLTHPERLWSKIDKSDDCWRWTGAVGGHGYGNFWLAGRTLRAHRLVYELIVGPIAPGLELDHLCRNTLCVNPGHLEPVTPKVNQERTRPYRTPRRPDECSQGHPLEGENVYVQKKTGFRYCRTCQRARDLAYQARKRAAA